MDILIVALFERIGILLIVAFMISRLPSFSYLLDRELNWKTASSASVFFGLFGIGGVLGGIPIQNGEIVKPLWLPILEHGDALAHSGQVGVVMAGLLGGPVVGLGAGSITGLYLLINGGITSQAYAVAAPCVGLLAGGIARFFSNERVISPVKSFFIGMFALILTCCFILLFTPLHADPVMLVNLIGIPMVLTNGIAIAFLTNMIRAVLVEKEQSQAAETERALKIANKVLPFLKEGLNHDTANSTASLLMKELQPAAVSMANEHKILTHIGLGSNHHFADTPIQSIGWENALLSGEVEVLYGRGEINCSEQACPLKAAILVPFHQAGQVAGIIAFYYKRPQQIRAVDIAFAQGLGRLISNQLQLAETERMRELIKDAELRRLEAQVNPHFLFNTLQAVVALIRINPSEARNMTLQLAQFMRTNLKNLSQSLISLRQELEQLQLFLAIIELRFTDRIQLELHIEVVTERQEAFSIPPFTLQPLVENSIQHGLKNKSSDGKITIHIIDLEECIAIAIEDNGTGISSDLVNRLGKEPLSSGIGNGIGVYNVNQRLITLLGESAALKIKNKVSNGTHISFQIPIAKQSP